MSITSSKGFERAACRHVRPGLVEIRCLCHEAELGIAALFDESIRIISASFICLGHISNDIGRRPDVMSKDFCRLRSKLLLQQALNSRIVISSHDVRVIEKTRC